MRHQNPRQRESVAPRLPENLRELKNWPAEDMIQTAETLGRNLERNLDTQLRKVFDSFKKLEMDLNLQFSRDEVLMLKPRLAYAVSRTAALRNLYRVLDQAIDRVYSLEDFKKLVQFVEAVLAYYKYHHPR